MHLKAFHSVTEHKMKSKLKQYICNTLKQRYKKKRVKRRKKNLAYTGTGMGTCRSRRSQAAHRACAPCTHNRFRGIHPVSLRALLLYVFLLLLSPQGCRGDSVY